MRARSVLPLAVLAVAAFLVAAAASRALAHRQPAAAPVATAAAARTTFPGLVAATGEPTLPSLSTLHPAPRSVTQAKGPFDDRFTLAGLRFDGSRVRGSVRITSDVSDVLDLQVVAGFYDRRGKLLGTARHVHHLDDGSGHQHAGPPVESEPFAIAVPARYRNAAVSAAVGVPVLVNE